MSWEGTYLIEVGECNRCSTIEQVGNRTGTRCVFVPTLDVRHLIVIVHVPLHWSVFMPDMSQSYYCEGGPRRIHIHYITTQNYIIMYKVAQKT